MRIGNGGGYFPSPYGPTSFNSAPKNYVGGPSSVPPYYNPAYQQPQYQNVKPQQQPKHQQQQAQQHPINQQFNSNSSSFKLYDLDTNEQSDIIRLIFLFAGVPYKDRRLKQEEWTKVQEHLSFEESPILRINNQFKIFQLHAIIRYLAREFNLYGVGQHDHAIIDIVLEITRSFQEKIFQKINNSTDNQEELLHQFILDDSSTYLNQLERLYEIFNHHGPFYLGLQISLADLVVYNTVNYLIHIDSKLLDNYPYLKEARRQLEKHSNIANYLSIKTNQNKTRSHKSPQSQRFTTKSPTPNPSSHHHHHHRHHSHEGHKSSNHHHHHHGHHHHHHHGHHSKEATPLSHTKQRSKRLSKSPTISTKEKEATSLPQTRRRSKRSSKSPTISLKEKESASVIQAKRRSLRLSKSPPTPTKGKEATPGKTSDVIPQPPAIVSGEKSESKVT